MGNQPTKEKISELIKECSKTNYSKNNIYKIEYQNDQEMDLYIEDDDYLYNKYHSKDNCPIFFDVENYFSFPYTSFGVIYFKLSNNEIKTQICFLIYNKIIATYFPFSDNENIIEIKTSFSDEILGLNSCKKFDNKNLAIFFLKNNNYLKWIGIQQYSGFLQEQKNKKKNVKIIFVREKKNLEEKIEILNNEEKIIQNENNIQGGVIYYKNKKEGAYVIGIIDENLNPILFDRETLSFLHKIIFGESKYSASGLDENVIELDLSKKNVGPSHIKILTEFNLINLKKLNLLKNQIGPQGAFYLGQSKFNNLENLILNFNDIGDEGIEYLSKGPFLNLKYLYLFHNNLTNKGVNFILESIFIDTLILLDLADNPNINNEGINYIKEKTGKNSNVLKNLKNLNLSYININDKAMEVISDINFQKLKQLSLKGIKFENIDYVYNILKIKNYEVAFDVQKII